MARRVDPISKIREQLLAKLGVTPQALNPRIGKVARDLAISADDAMLVLAHENRINISRLDAETLGRVRTHLARRAVDSPVTANSARPAKRAAVKQAPPERTVNIKIGDVSVAGVPCMDPVLATSAKKVAQDAYVRLFLIENSARDLIKRVMKNSYGEQWWDSNVNSGLQKKAARYSANELSNAWHPPRGTDPIQFIDLPDLAKIVEDNWNDFKAIFPKKDWFANFIESLNVTRRVVAHMTALSDNAYKYVDTDFAKWMQLLKAKASEIPA
jgi:hypothetical protein